MEIRACARHLVVHSGLLAVLRAAIAASCEATSPSATAVRPRLMALCAAALRCAATLTHEDERTGAEEEEKEEKEEEEEVEEEEEEEGENEEGTEEGDRSEGAAKQQRTIKQSGVALSHECRLAALCACHAAAQWLGTPDATTFIVDVLWTAQSVGAKAAHVSVNTTATVPLDAGVLRALRESLLPTSSRLTESTPVLRRLALLTAVACNDWSSCEGLHFINAVALAESASAVHATVATDPLECPQLLVRTAAARALLRCVISGCASMADARPFLAVAWEALYQRRICGARVDLNDAALVIASGATVAVLSCVARGVDPVVGLELVAGRLELGGYQGSADGFVDLAAAASVGRLDACAEELAGGALGEGGWWWACEADAR